MDRMFSTVLWSYGDFKQNLIPHATFDDDDDDDDDESTIVTLTLVLTLLP